MIHGAVFVGTSLDGFIARPDGGLDFLSPGGDVSHGFEEFMATIDALVMGRKTYKIVLDFGVWPYGEKPVFVLSSAEIEAPPEGGVAERMHGDPKDIAAEIAARGLVQVYVDGAATIQQFLRAGLIRRLIITRVPVLIGEGIPLFGELDGDISLRHIATRHYSTGLVQSEYEVAPDA